MLSPEDGNECTSETLMYFLMNLRSGHYVGCNSSSRDGGGINSSGSSSNSKLIRTSAAEVTIGSYV